MTTSSRSSGLLLAAGAAAFAAYVFSHPRGDDVRGKEDLDAAVHAMAGDAAWVPSHLIGIVATVLIAVAVWRLLRSGWLADQPKARIAGWVLFAGAIAASVELVPHTLAGYEADAFTAGESTPMTDLHVLLQAVLLPLYGVGVAALAAVGFGRVAHPVACALGVVGGVALAVVGPLLLATDNAGFGVVFMPGGGTFLFLFAAGVRLARSGRHQALITAT